ncbi:MAG: hypothetical protein HWE10_05110 [Gammaproteobacteria bacterium]|nr:hypothetical protein [Gammaproteobacteria bacterium]
MKRINGTMLVLLLTGCQLTSEPSVMDLLRQSSNDLNKTTPLMVDQETQLDSTYVLPNKFVYKYTLISYMRENLDAEKFYNTILQQVTAYVCSSPDMQFFVDNNVDVGYSYYDMDNVYITEAVVKTADCPS